MIVYPMTENIFKIKKSESLNYYSELRYIFFQL